MCLIHSSETALKVKTYKTKVYFLLNSMLSVVMCPRGQKFTLTLTEQYPAMKNTTPLFGYCI